MNEYQDSAPAQAVGVLLVIAMGVIACGAGVLLVMILSGGSTPL